MEMTVRREREFAVVMLCLMEARDDYYNEEYLIAVLYI